MWPSCIFDQICIEVAEYNMTIQDAIAIKALVLLYVICFFIIIFVRLLISKWSIRQLVNELLVFVISAIISTVALIYNGSGHQ